MKKLSKAGKPGMRRTATPTHVAIENDELRDMQLRLSGLLARYQDEAVDQPFLGEALAELQTSLEELFALQAERDDQNRQLQVVLQQLDSERNRYQDLFDLMPCAYVVTDHAGRIVEANTAAAELFHKRIQFLINTPIAAKTAVDQRTTFRNHLAQVLSTGEPQVWESTVLLQSIAKGIPVEIRLSTTSDGDGHRRLHWLLTDITKRIESREAIIRSERLSAIGQMVTGLAHESRNALQASQACLSMLSLEVRDRPAATDLIGRLRSAQHRLVHLYEQVRSYASPPRFEFARIDLVKLMYEVLDDLVFVHPGRILRLELLGHDKQRVTAVVDRVAMHQILTNIVDNAIAANDANPVIMYLDWANLDFSGKPMVQLRVRDNGPGLAPEVRQRLFEPFYTTKSKGSGLGMTIVRRLVEGQGGSIALGRETGEGAEFVINLPR